MTPALLAALAIAGMPVSSEPPKNAQVTPPHNGPIITIGGPRKRNPAAQAKTGPVIVIGGGKTFRI